MKGEEEMPKKFWIVWTNGYQGGIKRWPTYEAAAACAAEIARREPYKKVYILEALDYRWVPEPAKPPLEVHVLEKADDTKPIEV